MRRTSPLIGAASTVFLAALGCATHAEPESAKLEAAFGDFVAALEETALAVEADPAFDNDRHRAAGALYWAQMLLRTVEDDLLQEPDHPLFRVVDHRIREGADNPDQRYLFAPVRGGVPYRIWGRKRGERRIEVQVYAGLPWMPGGGRIVGVLPDEAIHTDAEGHFEITLGGEARSESAEPSNWLPNPDDATMVMVRQIYGEWTEDIGHVHIDRTGHEGDQKPGLTSDVMAERLERAARNLRAVVPLWPRFGRERYTLKEPNTLTAPWDPGASGGVVGRLMSLGNFELGPDQALILTTWPAAGNYQGVQLTDLWTSSLEYANRQTSLTADQAHQSSDGAYRMVIAHRDPGVQNWLDTTGLERGFILLRFDGVQGVAIPEHEWPRLDLVPFEALREHLPPETPVYSAEDRRREIERRRRHVQRRFGI
ncbi:MAG: DUF1214 domain-containing protein [bacterium]|nr:DUF1214 domain-containing protein [bacterium]